MRRRSILSANERVEPIDINDYLTFTVGVDGEEVYNGLKGSCEYCIDGSGQWRPLEPYTYAPALLAGQTVSFRASLKSAVTTDSGIGSLSVRSTSPVKVSGNIMSLLQDSSDGSVPVCAFKKFFINRRFKIDASELRLPATLANNCFESMFQGCTGLTSAPELPATTLANNCYWRMFQGCTSLTSAPELPATTLTNYCYNSMFYGCTGLTSAPELPATTLASSCYRSMFQDCTGLTAAPELPATTLTNYCYNSMFYGCTGLTSAPELPATTLAENCYEDMFRGCTGLTSAPELPATALKRSCYRSMLYGCTGLTSAPALPATALFDSCYSSMFYGCTGLTSAPELPATRVEKYSYSAMFQGCTNLSYIKAMLIEWGADLTTDWVKGVGSNGVFVKNSAATWSNTFGDSNIPTGWAVETAEA